MYCTSFFFSCNKHACSKSEEWNQTAFPKFSPSPSGAKTFKANLPVGGEGDYALHALAHLGDWQDLALWVCNSLHVQHLS